MTLNTFDMGHAAAHEQPFSFNQPPSSLQELARTFNSALVATRVDSVRDFSAELYALIQSPAFTAILESVRQLSVKLGVSEREAAEILVQTFRKIDRIWGDYILQEGVDRLKNQTEI